MPEAALILVISVAILIVSIGFLYRPFLDLCETFLRARHLSMVKIVRGGNTDEQAKDDFMRLIDAAKESIEIFDDGDDMRSSIYQCDEVIAKIKEKLRLVNDFKIECYFNDDKEMLFRSELDNEEGVQIYAGIDCNRPDDQTHYKIADRGRIAYLSKHGHGESERNYRLLDCTALKGRAFENTAGFLLE